MTPRHAAVEGTAVAGITFDFWNTVIADDPASRQRRVGVIRDALSGVDVDVSDDGVQAMLAGLGTWFDQRWIDNLVVEPHVGAVRAAEVLGFAADRRVIDAVETVFRGGSDPTYLRVAPGIGEVLAGLRAQGVRLGIISDTGFTPGARLRRYLDAHGLLDAFDHFSFSDEVGVFKPDQRIFAHAASGLGVDDPSRLAHVGDLRRTDVGGAVAAGWTGVRYRHFNDDHSDEPDASIVLDAHAELPAALGL